MLYYLTLLLEVNVGAKRAEFRLGLGFVEQTFILETFHTTLPCSHSFLDYKGTFDSVDRTRLFTILHQSSMSVGFVNPLRLTYSYIYGHIKVCSICQA